jgi:hypothetical protein
LRSALGPADRSGIGELHSAEAHIAPSPDSIEAASDGGEEHASKELRKELP